MGSTNGNPTPTYSVELRHDEPSDAIAADWRSLECHAEGNPFLKWLWIGTWLEHTDARIISARVLLDDKLIAMGLFGLRRHRRHGVLGSRVAYLHQGGDDGEDQIWVEYNGLLADKAHHSGALEQVLDELLSRGVCEEVHLSMVSRGSTYLRPKHPLRTALSVTGRYFNLENARSLQQSVISRFSANSRQQLRRALRKCEHTYGPAAVHAARSSDEAVAFFQEAGKWHRERWSDSGFNNPTFIRFHETLIKRGFHHGSVSLLRISFGDRVLGVFYFLVDGGRVYFYLQGLRGEQDGRLKTGLVSHLLCMEYFLDNGTDVYDFMGGDSQYKRQLADCTESFVTLRIHNGALKYRVEDTLRKLKRSLRGDIDTGHSETL